MTVGSSLVMELVMELAANFFIEPLYLMPSIVNAQLHQRKVFSLAFAMGKVYSLTLMDANLWINGNVLNQVKEKLLTGESREQGPND